MEQFLSVYRNLTLENLSTLEEIYTEEIRFIDPAHELNGLTELTNYFKNLYLNINNITYDFLHPMRVDDQCYLQWQMTFSHPKLKRGADITVHGTSFLQFNSDEKVHFHRDFFDLGSMIYQHLPLIGMVIKSLNRRLGS